MNTPIGNSIPQSTAINAGELAAAAAAASLKENQQSQYVVVAKIMFVVLLTLGCITAGVFTGIAAAPLLAAGGAIKTLAGVMVVSAAGGLVMMGLTAPLWGISSVQSHVNETGMDCLLTFGNSLATGLMVAAWPITIPVTIFASGYLYNINQEL